MHRDQTHAQASAYPSTASWVRLRTWCLRAPARCRRHPTVRPSVDVKWLPSVSRLMYKRLSVRQTASWVLSSNTKNQASTCPGYTNVIVPSCTTTKVGLPTYKVHMSVKARVGCRSGHGAFMRMSHTSSLSPLSDRKNQASTSNDRLGLCCIHARELSRAIGDCVHMNS